MKRPTICRMHMIYRCGRQLYLQTNCLEGDGHIWIGISSKPRSHPAVTEPKLSAGGIVFTIAFTWMTNLVFVKRCLHAGYQATVKFKSKKTTKKARLPHDGWCPSHFDLSVPTGILRHRNNLVLQSGKSSCKTVQNHISVVPMLAGASGYCLR